MRLRRSLWPVALFVMAALAFPAQHAVAGAEQYCSNTRDFQPLVVKKFTNGTQWSFCWEVRAQEGLRITHAFFKTSPGQGNIERRVLWQAHVAELFVPYDAGSPRYTDIHYGIGTGAVPLEAKDCPSETAPEERKLLRALPPGGTSVQRLVCYEVLDKTAVMFASGSFKVSKRGEEVAVWASHQIGNYNYILRWSFGDDGSFRPQAGLTGRLQIPNAAHTHNIYWRLDFDLSGASNDLVERFEHHPAPPMATDGWSPITTEAQEAVEPAAFRSWRVRDIVLNNEGGNPISYELVPSFEGLFHGTPQEPYAQADFWVTLYKPCEIYAILNKATSGNPGCPTDNVSEFISLPSPESVKGRDVVLWYALHLHHLPRAEDGPNMSVHWVEVLFRPRDFFNKNPLE